VLLQEFLSSFTKHWQLLMGAIIVALVLYLPGGLASVSQRFKKQAVVEADDD
jgi:branched-chain amino acid transport system permease protein